MARNLWLAALLGGGLLLYWNPNAAQQVSAEASAPQIDSQGGSGLTSPLLGTTIQELIDYQPLYGQSFGPETGNDRDYGLHAGIDFDCTVGGCAGADVAAMLGGKVIAIEAIATSVNGDSYRVVILATDSVGEVEHRYVHVDSLTVKEGEAVKTGQIIGKVSPTDSVSTGSHLDIKVWREEWINPQTYFAKHQNNVDLTSSATDDLVSKLLLVAQEAGHDTNKLSISILDIRSGKLWEHNGSELRYPASLVKVHWSIAAETLHPGVNDDAIRAALQASDNKAANLLLDSVGSEGMQDFWADLGHQGSFGGGFDGGGASNNRITTNDMVRLLAELHTAPPNHLEPVRQSLKRDFKKERGQEHNAIDGFLLSDYPDMLAFSKPGWVSNARGDAVLVELGNKWYAISVAGDSKSYAESETIFPALGYEIYHGLGGGR